MTLAEAGFFRIRWSEIILDETERAITKILRGKGVEDCLGRAAKARRSMEDAFEEARVDGFGAFLNVYADLPDPNDAHVVAAALKTRADVIVTDNVKHFPWEAMSPLDIEIRAPDAFIADMIALDHPNAIASIKRMRERFKRPEKTVDVLLANMDAYGLTETVGLLRPYKRLL